MHLILSILFTILVPLAAAAQDAPRVTVEGRGEVALVPDMATISISITREAEGAEAAMAALAGAAAAVLERIGAEGVADRDVQTGQLSLQPRWDRREDRAVPRIAGYVARSVLTVRVRDLEGLGATVSAAVADGANGLDGLSFGVAEPRPIEDAARRAAFADAMAKAQIYAEAAGMEVGPILSLREGGSRGGGPVVMQQVEMARSMPVAPGEVSQVVTVALDVTLVPAGSL